MYNPNSQIVDGLGQIRGDYHVNTSGPYDISRMKSRYKESDDLYDLQNQQASEVDSLLENTTGKDFLYMQDSIVKYRDDLKNLYKSAASTKDVKSPEFQTKLFQIRSELNKKANSINTFYSQVKEADKFASTTPSVKKNEWNAFLRQQLELPPDQRDANVLKTIQSDPLFFNPYDYAASVLKELPEADHFYTEDDGQQLINFEAKYRPDLGHFDTRGNFKFEPSDYAIEKVLTENTHFKNTMAGLLPAAEANELIGEGNHGTYTDALKDVTKKYLQQVHGFEPNRIQKSSKMKHVESSASEKKELAEKQEALAIQQNLQNGHADALEDYKVGSWNKFDINYAEDGQVEIAAHYTDDKEDRPSKKNKIEYIYVNPDDEGSVRQALNKLKFKNKTSVQPKALGPKSDKKYTIKGKSYTFDDLIKIGYKKSEVEGWIKDGTLK